MTQESLPFKDRYAADEPEDVCRQKHLGNEESEAANKAIDPWKENLRQVIFEQVARAGIRGMTSAEVVEATGICLQTVSGRLSELKMKGRLVATSRLRKTPSGASARVLVVA